jgi:group I intron endonuclease
MNNSLGWILYETTNLVNGKIYVGVHKLANTSKSRKYLGSGIALQLAIEKYGRENFTRVTLSEFSCAKDAYAAEAKLVTQEFCNREDVYNIKLGGYGGTPHTEDVLAKIRAGNIGKICSEEAKSKISASNKGNKYRLGTRHSEEAKVKLRILKTGKALSEEHKANIKATRHTGAKNSKSVAVIVDGRYYESMAIVAANESILRSTVRERIKNNKPKWAGWRYATETEKLEYTAKRISSTEETPNSTK